MSLPLHCLALVCGVSGESTKQWTRGHILNDEELEDRGNGYQVEEEVLVRNDFCRGHAMPLILLIMALLALILIVIRTARGADMSKYVFLSVIFFMFLIIGCFQYIIYQTRWQLY